MPELIAIGGGLAGSEAAWQAAIRIELKDYERDLDKGVRTGVQHFFEGCLPIEILAS